MGSGEESTPVKPPGPSTSAQETPTTTSYPDWSAQMQAYYGAGPAQPPFFPPTVASPAPYPYIWGGQHLVSPYGTPIPYPALYPHGGLYPHPNMAMAQGAAIPTTPTEGKDSVKKVKSSGNIGVVGGKSKESGKAASGSGNDGVSQSGESGSEGSSDASDDPGNHKETSENKRRSFDQMLADGAIAQNNTTDPTSAGAESSLNGKGEPYANLPITFPGHPAGDMAATNLNMGMDLWNASPVGSMPVRGRLNASGVLPAVVPIPRAGHEGIGPEHLWVQDERELKRQRRKLSNRESARRSRLRKQACDKVVSEQLRASIQSHTKHPHINVSAMVVNLL